MDARSLLSTESAVQAALKIKLRGWEPGSRIDNAHTDWVSTYLGEALRVVPILPRSKAPYRSDEPDPATGWHVVYVDDPAIWADFRRREPDCNVAIRWPGCQVDPDSEPALQWAREYGVESSARVWIIITARGYRLLYAPADSPLISVTSGDHEIPDLLAPGSLAVVPPSIHPSGVRYRWAAGHSPLDIPLADLSPPPGDLISAWLKLVQPRPINRYKSHTPPGWLASVFQSICDYLAATGRTIHYTRDGGATSTCPFHQDHDPSLNLHPVKGWKCWAGCGKGRLTLLAAKLGVRI